MLTMRYLGELTWAAGSGRRRHVSAASGIACVGGMLFAVADDELHAAALDPVALSGGGRMRLLAGKLPAGRAARKAAKPDFESLVPLPPDMRHPHGALLALGSGSTPRRMAGAVLPFAAGGGVGEAAPVTLAPLYGPLAAEFGQLNIEGAVVLGDRLLLFQRGNGKEGRNAVIAYELAAAMAALFGGPEPGRPAVTDVAIGDAAGAPLCFTDATALADGRIAFTAVAEQTDDPYHDGACVGAAVGVLDAGFRVTALHRIDPPLKVEGIAAITTEGAVELLLVTDPDDRSQPSRLYQARLPR
jgi:hypothetical protein